MAWIYGCSEVALARDHSIGWHKIFIKDAPCAARANMTEKNPEISLGGYKLELEYRIIISLMILNIIEKLTF